ncbi:hypothetical protein [Acidaminococcus timonensis]|uniref:hypothetical protein n=1 Tax=Acidaminococcus timonensis TaxID=1871002 RepID=UPI003078C18E
MEKKLYREAVAAYVLSNHFEKNTMVQSELYYIEQKTGKPVVNPTVAEMKAIAEKYHFPTTADQDVLGLAYTYGKDAFEEQEMEQARAVHRNATSYLSPLHFCYNGLKTEGGMQVGGWNESTGFYIAGSGWSTPFLIRVPG